jgi:hypothetical protein
MPTKRIFSAAFTALLLSTLSCDKGGPKLPVELAFQGRVEGVVLTDESTLSGVTVRLTGGQTRTLQTSATGAFSFPGLPEGSYLVEIAGYPEDVEFTATSKSASIHRGKASARVDFNGAKKRDGAISGTVTMEGAGMEGVSVSVSGPELRSTTTDSQGVFAFDQLKRGVYTVTLSGFDPAFHSFPIFEQTVDAQNGNVVEAHFSGTLVPQPPEAPIGPTAVATGHGTVALSWTDTSDDETRFEIERRNGAQSSWTQIAAPDPNATAFGDVGLSPNTTYTYRVRACNDVGCSAFSGEAEATTEDVAPEDPTELGAVATGSSTVELSWTDGSNNEARFEVERKEGAGGDWSQIGTPDPEATAFGDAGLTPKTTYVYRVRACNEVGCSAYSNEAGATTDEVAPEAPSGLIASATGSTTASLTWTDGSNNETRFEIERKMGAGGDWVLVGTSGPDAAAFGDTGLTPNTTYTYRVRACNEVGCSAYSNEASAVTNEVAPEAPTGLDAVATGSTTVGLTWTDASDNEALFRVERRRGTIGAWSEIGAPGPNMTGIGDTGLSPNTIYRYRVRACNGVGCSPYSNEAQARTDEVPPEAPSGLGAVASGATTVDLSWTDESNNETRFELERKEGAGGSWGQIGTPDANATTYGDTGLDPSTTYFYRVRACNAAGCSAYADETNATTSEAPPEAPTGLTAGETGSTTVTLGWTDGADNENLFRIERKKGAGGVFAEITTRPENSTSFGDSGLSPNTTYFYRVMACNAGGCSAPSNVADATTWNVPPEAPTGLSAAATGSTTVDLSWTDLSDNETGFRVERKEGAAGVFSEAGTVAANTTSFPDTGLSPNTTYYYRVFAFNPSGDSSASDQANATTWAGSGPNLSISSIYVTQSTQTLGGAVPLVADKDGYLRVFAVASEANSFQPSVRVRFYLGGALAHTEVISSPGSSVPTGVNESILGASWNVNVPGSLLQPGLSILADVDPTNQVAEGNEGDNSFPIGGSPLAMDVRTTSTFEVTFVPVRQSVNSLLGNVTPGNAAQYMDVTMRLLPIAQANVEVHAEYVTDAPVLESNNGNSAWGTILGEVNSLRVIEGASRYYYGVVKTTYSSGVAGMGYLGWATAIGWDRLPSGSGVAAHEWGHNWDRYHAPGCGAGSPDPLYPYADGKIGVWGLDVGVETLKSPTTHYDFMSYCNPDWISDYSYEAIMNYRQAHGGYASPGEPEPSLLVWGRMEGDRIVLEPAFEVTTTPALPTGSGEYRLEGLGQMGDRLFSLAFQPIPVPDAGEGDGHFAFAIPLRSFDRAGIAGLRVSGGGRSPASMESRIGPEMVSAPEPEITPRGGSVVEVTWDATSFPMALVRDPSTGEVLSFARGGRISLSVSSDEIEVILSDGLKSSGRVRRTVR